MSENTKIEWTDHTYNPWIGCTKVSPACLHCYAEAICDTRFGWVQWGQGRPRRRASAETLRLPLRWERAAAKSGRRTKVFCASLADVFDPEVNPAWRADLFRTIAATPSLDWQLLTKRPEKIRAMLPADYPDGLAHVWLGTSVENQDYVGRAFALARLPAAVHFLSIEPMLGPVDLRELWAHSPSRKWWVICGGESDRNPRPMQIEWVRDLRAQCLEAEVPFFFKQWGGRNKREAGRLLDGCTYDEFPTPLRSRSPARPAFSGLGQNEGRVA